MKKKLLKKGGKKKNISNSNSNKNVIRININTQHKRKRTRQTCKCPSNLKKPTPSLPPNTNVPLNYGNSPTLFFAGPETEARIGANKIKSEYIPNPHNTNKTDNDMIVDLNQSPYDYEVDILNTPPIRQPLRREIFVSRDFETNKNPTSNQMGNILVKAEDENTAAEHVKDELQSPVPVPMKTEQTPRTPMQKQVITEAINQKKTNPIPNKTENKTNPNPYNLRRDIKSTHPDNKIIGNMHKLRSERVDLQQNRPTQARK